MVPDAANDSRFADNPMVTGSHGIRFYAGVPLTSQDGNNLGMLMCKGYCSEEFNTRSAGMKHCRRWISGRKESDYTRYGYRYRYAGHHV